jgi:hypothetical protein
MEHSIVTNNQASTPANPQTKPKGYSHRHVGRVRHDSPPFNKLIGSTKDDSSYLYSFRIATASSVGVFFVVGGFDF